jgi:3-phosphoglycerate kinase
MIDYPLLRDTDIKGKRVLMRAGFDVPIEDGEVIDISRVHALLPTMQHIIREGASLILLAHQGRPKGEKNMEFTQKPLVAVLEKLLDTRVQFAESCVGPDTIKQTQKLQSGDVLLLENIRFKPGEKSKNPAEASELAGKLAELADVYVNDAFTNCHRDHASMTGVPKLLPHCMGLRLEEEVRQLSLITDNPEQPVTLIVSGSKMETKVPVIEQFLDKGQHVLVGGAIANTFIAAQGNDVGTSKYEPGQIEKAKEIIAKSKEKGSARLHIPQDAIVASEVSDDAESKCAPVGEVSKDMKILDIGSETARQYADVIKESKTIAWNGPMGVHELPAFSSGTRIVSDAVIEATEKGATSLIGGGDTLGFHTLYSIPMDRYTFVSMGGGAMLKFVSGQPLPALEALRA